MTKMSATYRTRNAQRTGKRIRVMNELIQGIQVVKMYAWEHSFAHVVDTIRKYAIHKSFTKWIYDWMMGLFPIL